VAELRIEGFGRLANLSLRFAPGLNLVYGPNEAGKSTLLEALLATLYGFVDEGAAAAYRPSSGAGVYAASLTYALDAGAAYRVTRRFLPRAEASLHSYPAGEDCSALLTGRRSLAEAHWGLGREGFEGLCVARQGGPLALQASAALAGALRQRLATAAPDAAVSRATGLLETALKERVGAPHSRSRPLSQALARLARLEDERQRALQLRRDLVPRLTAVRVAAERLEALDGRRAALLTRQAEAAARAAQVSPPEGAAVSAEVQRCEAEVARWQAWAGFPVVLRDTLLRLSAQHTRLQEDCALAERRGRRAQEALAQLEAQEATLQERLAPPPATGLAPAAEFARIQALASEWRMASELEWSANERYRTAQPALEALLQRLAEEGKEVEPLLPAGPAGLTLVQERLKKARERLAQAKGALAQATAAWARLGMEEAEFQRLEHAVRGFRSNDRPEPRPEPRQGRRWLSALLGRGEPEEQAPPGLASYGEVQPVYAEMARCRDEAEAAQRALSDIEAATLWQLGRLLGGTLEEAAFEQLRTRLERHLRAQTELEQQRITVSGLRSELDQARQRREKAQTALQIELGRLGFTATELHKALADYVRQHEQQKPASTERVGGEQSHRRAETELELLRARAEAQRIELERWQEKQAALSEIDTQLTALLTQAGISSNSSLERALEAFDEGVANYRRWEQAKTTLDAAMRYQRTLFEARPRARRGHGDAAAAGTEVAACAAELAHLDEERAQAQEDHSRLEAEVQQAMVGVRHLAEIDEEIALEQGNVRRLEELRSALELARDELVGAGRDFQQQFTPRLEALVREGLKQVTADRYVEAVVDEANLALTVHAPGLGGLVPPACLGAATRDLAHLLLRAALVRLMGHCGEKLPLLLDEPLAQCDAEHQERALGFLAHVAEEAQVVLFTADERVKARFEQASKSPRHQLHLLNVA